MTPSGPPEFEEALRALTGPLQYASANGFERLERVKDLEATLRQAAERAQSSAPDGLARAALTEVRDLIPDPAAPRGLRVERFRRILERLRRLLPTPGASSALHELAAEPPPGAESRPEPRRRGPPSTKTTRGVRPVAIDELKRAITAPATPPLVEAPQGAPEPMPAEPSRSGARPARIPSPQDEAKFLKGVGPKIAALLATRGIVTVHDLLRFLPRRYEDRRAEQRIGALVVGTTATVEGTVLDKSLRFRGRSRSLEVTLGDSTGAVSLVWFRVPGGGFADRFVKGARFRVAGPVKNYRGRLQIAHPETRKVGEGEVGEPATPGETVVPAYLEIEGLAPAQLRRIIEQALPACAALPEPLPAALLARHGLPALGEAVAALHRPPQDTEVEKLNRLDTPWHRRLIYEELLFLQLAVLQRRAREALEPGRAIALPEGLGQTAGRLFAFPLTSAQRRVLDTFEHDLRSEAPMNRLLQGDVGSGKTAVALTLAAAVAKAGEQAAIMAPTEILAEQHARVALKALTPAGIRVGLLTGSLSASDRKETLGHLRSGRIQVVVGTHAVIMGDIGFRSLALGVVDEQHRFGVMQRGRLAELGRQSRGCAPHMLVMTATPIPRTLALTVYGNLETCKLDELPPGRIPIRTKLYRERQRAEVYERVRAAAAAGRQAYVVFPLVEESESEGMENVRDATSAAEELANGPLAGLAVGLLHGRMTGDEKDAVMRRFAENRIQVLVATTVIEVGVDVANATVMVIEHAERFGLSQLHQLRGRVGRGVHQSECLLLAQYTASDDAWRRLSVLEATNDGFRIAEEDLEIRGPGDFIGTRQSGLPVLQVANLVRDQALLEAARADAKSILTTDPGLESPEHAGIRQVLGSDWRQRLELARIG